MIENRVRIMGAIRESNDWNLGVVYLSPHELCAHRVACRPAGQRSGAQPAMAISPS